MTDGSTPRVTPRIEPLPRDRWGEDVRTALRDGFSPAVADRFFATGPDAIPIPHVVGTLMRHPALAGPFLAYNTALLGGLSLDPRLRELMVLRVAWRTQSAYEWAQHVRMAPRVAIADDDVDAISGPPDAPRWSPLEAAALAAVDELLEGYRVSDATWRVLATHLDERQLVELTFVVGTYVGLAMVFNSLGLELDPELLSVTPVPPTDHED